MSNDIGVGIRTWKRVANFPEIHLLKTASCNITLSYEKKNMQMSGNRVGSVVNSNEAFLTCLCSPVSLDYKCFKLSLG